MDFITKKQMQLIDCMNEFCEEKFLYTENTLKKDASNYISKNIEEYKLKTMSMWQYQYM